MSKRRVPEIREISRSLSLTDAQLSKPLKMLEQDRLVATDIRYDNHKDVSRTVTVL